MGNEETRWGRSFRAPRGVQLPPRLGARKAFRDQLAKPRVKAFGGDREGRRHVNNIGDLGRFAHKVKPLEADQLAKPRVKAFGGDRAGRRHVNNIGDLGRFAHKVKRLEADQLAKPRVKAFGGDRAGRRHVNNIGDLGRFAHKVKRLVADQLAKPLVKAFGGDQTRPMHHVPRHLRGFAPRANGFRGDRLGRAHGFGDSKGFGGNQAGRRHVNNIGDLGRFAHKVKRLGADQLGKPHGFIRELGGRVAPWNYGVDEVVITHGHDVENLRGFAHKVNILVGDMRDKEPAKPPAHGMFVDIIMKISIRFEKSFRIA